MKRNGRTHVVTRITLSPNNSNYLVIKTLHEHTRTNTDKHTHTRIQSAVNDVLYRQLLELPKHNGMLYGTLRKAKLSSKLRYTHTHEHAHIHT